MEKTICHDCGRELAHNDEFMPYEAAGQKFAKCRACHEIDPVLRDFQETEVYSRVVGYIRPVKQWNGAKQTEFSDRKEFVLADNGCC
ncbi:MAG: anaerobic ribonucleoside-triphosphate reductase [Candidatus Pacebacteria bacterium]|nr:anaerobic ribonucleoside-triphosphate reductase [Candidatus Paceibacterota bacterium]MDR3583088.1 anaerobic ribonucleoside-triphosphate reductase [Candidatus Paceibacterota bacterium]